MGTRLEDDDGNQTDEYLTIESLPDGILSEGILKTGDRILNTILAESYGNIYEIVKWEDIKLAENLQNKAMTYLADSIKFKNNIIIKAIDLKLTENQIGTFKIGEYIRCYSSPHGISDLYLLQKLSLNIKDSQNTTIEINHVSRALTDKILQNKRNTDNITARIDRVERGYVNNGNITDIANEIIENSSAFEQNSKAIMAQVSELYTKITDFETYKKSVSTQFTQTDNSFNYQFNNLTEVINNLDADSAAQFNNIIKYIRFAECSISSSISSVNNKNTKEFKIMYKKVSVTSWNTVTLSTSNYSIDTTRIIQNIDTESEYNFKILATDFLVFQSIHIIFRQHIRSWTLIKTEKEWQLGKYRHKAPWKSTWIPN